MRISIRRSVVIGAVSLFVFLYFCGAGLFTLISLWFENWQTDAIHLDELNSTYAAKHPPQIPKIIHQTYINESIPKLWQPAQQSCLEKHKDWEYMLWTDARADLFIATEYPWFKETWDSYEFNIQRADVIRYFVLAHYGGIYLDFDKGCRKSLEPLRNFPAFVRATQPTGISNDIMGSIAEHPLFIKTIYSLPKYNRNWLIPYITVMYSTGPLFLSVIWKEYIRWGVPEDVRVRVLMPPQVENEASSYFEHYVGSSWHNKDAKAFLWMADHIMLVTIFGIALGVLVLIVVRWIYLASCAMDGPRSASPRRFIWRGAVPISLEDIENIPLMDRKV